MVLSEKHISDMRTTSPVSSSPRSGVDFGLIGISAIPFAVILLLIVLLILTIVLLIYFWKKNNRTGVGKLQPNLTCCNSNNFLVKLKYQ